ncbi:unnamed protein product [Lactuca saligna]|uniref:BAH domain-containing protein n=1 Tax=Lactuca saligna TaxID=75948 RepID=A0AA35VLU0_LACSI|nr:unnamed protein product [Lactuca saligna]
MRMELLVLLSLQWKMNPVTPLAIFDYTMRRLGLITHRLHSEFMNRCERIALAVVNDSRSLVYLPSVMAVAIMFLVFKVIDPDNSLDYQERVKGFLQIKEGEGKQKHVGRTVEFFKTSNDKNHSRVQWVFRAEDTVMKKAIDILDNKRLFASTLMNDNLLDCILSKVKMIEKAPGVLLCLNQLTTNLNHIGWMRCYKSKHEGQSGLFMGYVKLSELNPVTQPINQVTRWPLSL